jgi:DUF4097 and DUF4098 domain-containing protein YvlB
LVAVALSPLGLAQQFSVPFRNPSEPGTVKVKVMSGAITVKGYDGNEVVVEADSRRGDDNRKEDEKDDPQREGLRLLPIGGTGLTVEEDNNVIEVGTDLMGPPSDLKLQVPVATSLKLSCLNNGAIVVDNVEGEIEVSNMNGSVILTNVAGTVVANSLNGRITAVMKRVTPEKPMSFVTMNGDIDVTLPADVKGNVQFKTQNGRVYTDFEVTGGKGSGNAEVEDARNVGGPFRMSFDRGFDGTLNGGGPEMRFKTVNGSIYLRKSQD